MLVKIKKLSALFIVPGALILSLGTVGCDLDAENPNSLVEDDLTNPAVAGALANGALNTLSLGTGYVLCPVSVASDEATWIGSRDAWGSLDKGQISDVYNEFVDFVWPYITEGRWMCDRAVTGLEAFKSDGILSNDILLAKAYLYAGAVRCVIADSFEDFVYSDKTVSGQPIGTGNMMQVYDEAMTLFKSGLAIAQSEGDTDLEAVFHGMLARAAFSKEVHSNIGNAGGVVTASMAASHAQDALDIWDATSTWQLQYSSSTVSNEFSWQINGRSELEFGFDPGTQAGDDLPEDLIDTDLSVNVVDLQGNDMGPADPRLAAIALDFFSNRGGTDYAPVTMVSGAEMYLILAENAYASGNDDDALTYLNMNRTGMTAYDGSNASVADAIVHERRANLYAQGKRLLDMYRFGATSVLWESQYDALGSPGSLFPITIQEIRANEFVLQPG